MQWNAIFGKNIHRSFNFKHLNSASIKVCWLSKSILSDIFSPLLAGTEKKYLKSIRKLTVDSRALQTFLWASYDEAYKILPTIALSGQSILSYLSGV